jgi:hypothetical protein
VTRFQLMRLQVSTLVLLTSTFVFAAPTAEVKSDATQVDSACKSDGQMAGCGTEVVGKGLLKCLHQYRKTQRATNKAFAYSPGCQGAIAKLRADRKSSK